MPQKVEDCVDEVMEDGKTESEAWAICRAAVGATRKPNKWSDAMWNKLKKFSKAPDADEKVDASKSFFGVELARTGSFQASTGPVVFTQADFDNAQRAYEALQGKHEAAIKLGHDDEQKLLQADGYPNAGIIENVRREGDRLVADLIDVPDVVADLIVKKRYNTRSIEALRNGMVAGRRWPFVLTGLALLGADLPAVDSLKDIAAIYAERGIDVPQAGDDDAEVVMLLAHFDGEGVADVDELVSQLNTLLQRAETIIHKRGGAPKFRTLVKTAVDELRAISKKRIKNSAGGPEVDTKALATALGLPEDATEEEVMKKVRQNASAAKKAEADAAKAAEEAEKAGGDKDKTKDKASSGDDEEKSEVETLREELAETRKTVVALQTESETTKATAKVDSAIKAGKFVPASRATLIQLAVQAPKQFDEMLKASPDGVIRAGTGQEQGRDGGGSNEDIEVTAMEVAIAAQSGLTEDELKAQKYIDAGKAVPKVVQDRIAAARAKK
jgi:hypothetical protein